jgi:RHS repeat-associated protein
MAGISDKAVKWGYAENKYRFGDKQLQSQEFSDGAGMEEYDCGSRFLNIQLGRWWTVDPFAAKYANMSPYCAMDNNPLSIIDPIGKSGEPAIDREHKVVTITSNLIFYGDKASSELATQTAANVQDLWNDANGKATIDGVEYSVKFVVTGQVNKGLTEQDVKSNTDIKNNYIKVEDNIPVSMTQSKGSTGGNTGTWLYNELIGANSTTAAHEYGHSLGEVSSADGGGKGLHPAQTDIRSETDAPGIMCEGVSGEGVIDRAGKDARRAENLSGIQTKKGADRDEFPPAVIDNGGNGQSVQYINPSDNRGAGSSIGHQIQNLPDGTRVVIRIPKLKKD